MRKNRGGRPGRCLDPLDFVENWLEDIRSSPERDRLQKQLHDIRSDLGGERFYVHKKSLACRKK
jgi:hypothetical protein